MHVMVMEQDGMYSRTIQSDVKLTADVYSRFEQKKIIAVQFLTP